MSAPLPDSTTNLLSAGGVGLAGLLIGSFLNVCIFRIPQDLSVVAPRSYCPECETQISWYDNVPLLSFILLRGRCRNCRTRISFRYPLVEAITAAAFGVVAWRYGLTLPGLKWMLFEAIMVVLYWTDLETQILPDEFTLGGTVAGGVLAWFVAVPGIPGQMFAATYPPIWRSVLNMVAGSLLLAGPLWMAGALYGRLRKRDALGFGDVKLLLLIGSFLGVGYGFMALMAGAVTGAFAGITIALLTRKQLSTYELPFGSFLCGAAALIPLLLQVETAIGQ